MREDALMGPLVERMRAQKAKEAAIEVVANMEEGEIAVVNGVELSQEEVSAIQAELSASNSTEEVAKTSNKRKHDEMEAEATPEVAATPEVEATAEETDANIATSSFNPYSVLAGLKSTLSSFFSSPVNNASALAGITTAAMQHMRNSDVGESNPASVVTMGVGTFAAGYAMYKASQGLDKAAKIVHEINAANKAADKADNAEPAAKRQKTI